MPMVILHNATFYTSQELYDTGNGACCECGTPNKLYSKICDRCLKPLIVIRDCYIPKQYRLTEEITDEAGRRRFIKDLSHAIVTSLDLDGKHLNVVRLENTILIQEKRPYHRKTVEAVAKYELGKKK